MTLTDTRKALQDILEEATATDCAVFRTYKQSQS